MKKTLQSFIDYTLWASLHVLDKELSFVFKGKNADFVVITPTDKMKSIVNDKLFDLYNYRLSA